MAHPREGVLTAPKKGRDSPDSASSMDQAGRRKATLPGAIINHG